MMHISHNQRTSSAIPARVPHSFGAVPFYNYNSRFLKIDTFTIKLTKQRKTVTIQFSRCCSDNNLQLHTHIHQPAFIGKVGVNISVQSQGNTAVTEDGGESFHIKSLLSGIGRKRVAELVVVVIF